ncbi:MAG: S41 family peptidase [Muribaculaceae bacterium]|nr:S41 family peptidase [Muribaculaceae bacterium]
MDRITYLSKSETYTFVSRLEIIFMRILSFLLMSVVSTGLLWSQPKSSLTVDQNVEDFDFALTELETSYAGFVTYVNDSTRQEYDSIVSSLKHEIELKIRPGYDAALFLYSWFDDGHLGMDMGSYKETGKYMSDRRKYQPYEMIRPYLPEPIATQATTKTYLIRLPEFDEEIVSSEWLGNAIDEFISSKCENLIIDVRGNGGGDERIWHQLLPLFYDHPGTTKSVEFRMSDNNIEFLKQAAAEFPEAQMILDKFNNTHEEFILLTDKEDIEIEVPKYDGKKPRRIAFIIDANNGSATEELLIQAKAISDRAIIYGKENTGGCLDCSSVRESALPNSGYPIFIPTARSCRLPNNGIDKTGIAPDVVIPINYPTSISDNIDEWTLWIANELENNTY